MREVPLEGFETGTWLPYPVTILNFSEETAMDGMDGTDGHMEFWVFFGPNESADPAEGHQFHRFQPIKSHLCHCPAPLEKPWEPTKPMIRGPDGPSGDWPWWPSCEKNLGGASQALPKRIVSQNCRLIFFGGVEGTCHHFWHSLLPHLHPFTTWSENFSSQLYDKDHKVGYFQYIQ